AGNAYAGDAGDRDGETVRAERWRLRYGRRGVLRWFGAGLFELGTVLRDGEFVTLHFLPVVMNLKAEALGEHVLEHEIELLAGGAFGNLDRYIEARLVHPVRSHQLLGAQ